VVNCFMRINFSFDLLFWIPKKLNGLFVQCLVIVCVQKLPDGNEIDLKLLGEALFGQNEVAEVCQLLGIVCGW